MHSTSHPLAGQTVKIKKECIDPVQNMVVGGATYHIEDWWDVITGGSWTNAHGNFAAMHYSLRSSANGLPIDNEVLYGKISGLGHLVHISEIEELR